MILSDFLTEKKHHRKHHAARHSVYHIYRGGYPALDSDGDYDNSPSGESEAGEAAPSAGGGDAGGGGGGAAA